MGKPYTLSLKGEADSEDPVKTEEMRLIAVAVTPYKPIFLTLQCHQYQVVQILYSLRGLPHGHH